MARPEVGPIAEEMYEALGFYASRDEELGWPLLRFVAAWCAPLERVYELSREREDRPGWAILFDPDEAPAETLPYLACIVGAVLTPEMDEAQRRAEIKEPSSHKRGQVEAFKTSLRATLTGTKRVIVRERTPEPHSLYVRVLASECPSVERTLALARERKVAGLLMDFAALEGVSWADIAAGWESWADVAAAFETWGTVADLLPDELPEP